eukprot:GEMP01034988.1.p1 GENE.GEMP01034988.1~~GEMP01034988.1.p1  ORF type:complete len:196 (+),score=32.16 GEMP01034988.1:71-658(+)
MLRCQLVLLAVGATESDREITAAGAKFLKQALPEAEKNETKKYTLITDASKNLQLVDSMFDGVGNGYCASAYRTLIHGSITYLSPQNPWTYENQKCQTQCRMMLDCVGYNSMATYCQIIRESDIYSGGGIVSTTQSFGVTCFRKRRMIPHAPRFGNRYEMIGGLVILAVFLTIFTIITLVMVRSATAGVVHLHPW